MEKQQNSSFPASNSTFNFNLEKSCDIDSNSRMHQYNLSANSSSNYDDDDVFSANTSFTSPSLNQSNKSQNENKLDNQNFDTITLAQLYRNFLSN
jgi:protein required for attachment to host cells